MQGYGATECGIGLVHDPRGPRPRDGRPDDAAGSRCAWPTTARSTCAARRSSRATGTSRRRRRRRSRRRLVPDRRHRPVRRRRPPDPHGPDQGHHRAAERLQRVSRGHRERPADGRHPRLGRGRDEARPDRGDRPRAGLARPAAGRRHPGRRRRTRRRIRAASATGSRPRVKAANATLGRPSARRRLAPLARGRLPAHPHPQGEARPGPRLGRRRRAAAGPRPAVWAEARGLGRDAPASAGSAPRRRPSRAPSRSRRVRIGESPATSCRRSRSCRPGG